MTMDTDYSRQNPSPRYRALVAIYQDMHEHGDVAHGHLPEHTFDGRSLAPHTATVRDLTARTGARTLLDYGAGKGGFYKQRGLRDPQGNSYDSIKDYWNLSDITLYDPGYAPYSAYPSGTFDAVISTDVLEHIPEEDVPWILREMFGFAEKMLFVTIAGYPAGKILPNGENAHCTLKPMEWWAATLSAAKQAVGKPDLPWFALYIDHDEAKTGFRHRTMKG